MSADSMTMSTNTLWKTLLKSLEGHPSYDILIFHGYVIFFDDSRHPDPPPPNTTIGLESLGAREPGRACDTAEEPTNTSRQDGRMKSCPLHRLAPALGRQRHVGGIGGWHRRKVEGSRTRLLSQFGVQPLTSVLRSCRVCDDPYALPFRLAGWFKIAPPPTDFRGTGPSPLPAPPFPRASGVAGRVTTGRGSSAGCSPARPRVSGKPLGVNPPSLGWPAEGGGTWVGDYLTRPASPRPTGRHPKKDASTRDLRSCCSRSFAVRPGAARQGGGGGARFASCFVLRFSFSWNRGVGSWGCFFGEDGGVFALGAPRSSGRSAPRTRTQGPTLGVMMVTTPTTTWAFSVPIFRQAVRHT